MKILIDSADALEVTDVDRRLGHRHPGPAGSGALPMAGPTSNGAKSASRTSGSSSRSHPKLGLRHRDDPLLQLASAIVEHLPDMVFVKEVSELRFVHVNPKAEELMGRSFEELVGRNSYDFFPPEQADFFSRVDRQVLAEGRVVEILAEPMDTPNGRRIVHTKKIPIPGPDGSPMFLLGISEDITEMHNHLVEEERLRNERRARIESVLEHRAVQMVFQPIVDLATLTIVGAEALARFSAEPKRTPDLWFGEAAEVGLGVDLELLAVEKALESLDSLPSSAYLSINLSPAAMLSGQVPRTLAGHLTERLVLELTEHNSVDDYPELNSALDEVRSMGVRVAVDDAGSGYSSFQHIVSVAPDIIKLDVSLTRGIDHDRARRALASALVHFQDETHAVVVAEGIETEEELGALRSLGVSCGQGYHLGRPGPLPLPEKVLVGA